MEIKERIQREGRIVGQLLPQVFDVNRWVSEDLDDSLMDWQIQEGNEDKSIPLLLLFLLHKSKRAIFKRLYDERYNTRMILPEWDCIPMYHELELFVQNEDDFFQSRYSFSFSELFDSEWSSVVTEDICYCDFEMFTVQNLLTMDE